MIVAVIVVKCKEKETTKTGKLERGKRQGPPETSRIYKLPGFPTPNNKRGNQ